MPIHNWKRVDAGTFHDFHQVWAVCLRNALNGGTLPKGYFALTDQIIGGPVPDVVTLRTTSPTKSRRDRPTSNPVALADAPPKAQFISQAQQRDIYAKRADRIVIKHPRGDIVAVIEIVSPGNKSGQTAFRSFVENACELIDQGIHFLVVDLFPPTSRDPQGIHGAIWRDLTDESFELPADKPLTVASYNAGLVKTAYVEPVAVGDALPDMPIFLTPETYVLAPLERTYLETWDLCPDPIRDVVEGLDESTNEAMTER